MKFIVQNKTVLTYGLTLINLVAIVLISLLGTNTRLSQSTTGESLYQTIHLMDKLSQDLLFSEAYVNNFILTSSPEYIDKYRHYRLPLEQSLSSLEEAFKDNREQAENIVRLKQLINKKIYDLESSIYLKKQNGLLSASEYLQLRKQEKGMEQIKSIQEALLKEQRELIKIQQSKMEFSVKSREYIIVSASIASLLISVIAIGTIVTDLNEKREREKYLESVNENKDKFFTLISHDLKGPAQNLIGISEILLNDRSLSEEENQTFLQHLNETAKKNFNLLDNLLEWSRVQMGSVILAPEAFSLREAGREVIAQTEERADQKHIEIKNNIPPDVKVYADFNSTKTIIRNLVTNAIKYTPKKGVITISASTYKREVTISVSDTGIGMCPEIRKNLFKPGKIVSRYGTQGETGTGIGLLLCKEFIENNHGNIWVESKESQGSTFHFTLPVPAGGH